MRLGFTRFASSFLKLQSLVKKEKEKLRLMFSSYEWGNCERPKEQIKNSNYDSLKFNRKDVNFSIQVFGPLVKVLRLVDGVGLLKLETRRCKERKKREI